MEETLLSSIPDGFKAIAFLGAGIGMAVLYWLKFIKNDSAETIQQEIINQLRAEKEYEREQRLEAEKDRDSVLNELFMLRSEVHGLRQQIEGLQMLIEKYGLAGDK